MVSCNPQRRFGTSLRRSWNPCLVTRVFRIRRTILREVAERQRLRNGATPAFAQEVECGNSKSRTASNSSGLLLSCSRSSDILSPAREFPSLKLQLYSLSPHSTQLYDELRRSAREAQLAHVNNPWKLSPKSKTAETDLSQRRFPLATLFEATDHNDIVTLGSRR